MKQKNQSISYIRIKYILGAKVELEWNMFRLCTNILEFDIYLGQISLSE